MEARVAVLEEIASSTKATLKELRDDLRSQGEEMRAEFKAVRGEIRSLAEEMRAEFKAQREETRAEFKAVRGEIRDLSIKQEADSRILLGVIIAVALGLTGIMAKGFHWY